MNTKITTLLSLFIFALFMGCSGDESGSSCGKVDYVSFNAYPSRVALNFSAGNNANSFKIEYGPSGFRPGTGTVMTTSDTQVEIGELTPSTTYDFYITGICSANESSAPYKLSSVTTQASQCTGATSVHIGQLYTNEVELEFSYSGGYAEKFEVEYGTAGFVLGTGTREATSFGSASKTITGIEASTAYDFYVRSYCPSGETTAFVKFSYTTMMSCPKPINLNSWVVSGACNAGMGATRGFSWSYPYGSTQSYTISVIQSLNEAPGSNTFVTSTPYITLQGMYCLWKGFYVKASCSATESSEWAGPYYF